MALKSECKQLLVAAMDFGTTYSGYAFSLTSEPLKVNTNQAWVAGSRQLVSLKTTTCILLNPQQKFHSFGYEAENKYADLALDGEHGNWYFFKQFKVLLHNTEGLKQTTLLQDISGRSMPAMTILSLSIKYLKDHLMETLGDRIPGITQSDVHFVITVPAIWDDLAKQYMRDAAVKVGISNDQLSIALEPEAAAVWCHCSESPKSPQPVLPSMYSLFNEGTRYMVVDLGGGTVDIAVHELKLDGSLGELYKASGGLWGGTCVDKNFLAFISKILGQEVLQEFMRKEMSDYMDLLREFETKKRTIKSNIDGKITFKMPSSLKEIFEKKGGELQSAISRSNFQGKVFWDRDKLRIDPSLGIDFFKEPILSTINHVKVVMSDPGLRDVKAILLVGGFAECDLVKAAFKKNFREKRIVIPEEAGLVVLKGAVVSGHDPRVITTRIARFSYGTRMTVYFDPAIHPPERRVVIKGKVCYDDVYNKLVEIGHKFEIGHTVSSRGYPVSESQKNFLFELFTSAEQSPKYVTDPSCRLLGKFMVPVPEGKTINHKVVEYTTIFGGTELNFKVKHLNNGQEFNTYFQYD